MSPVRPQLGPPPDQAGAPDDQPPPAVDGFGDLRLAVVGVVDALSGVLVDLLDGGADVLVVRTAIEYCQPAFCRRLNTRVFQNPESALSSLAPVAPARSTRAISSSMKRSMPFWVFADPFLRRICSTSRVSARVARIGWQAQHAGIAVGGALLEPAADLADEAVDVDHQRPAPGPAPACQARSSARPSRASSWRTCPNVNGRSGRVVGEARAARSERRRESRSGRSAAVWTLRNFRDGGPGA